MFCVVLLPLARAWRAAMLERRKGSSVGRLARGPVVGGVAALVRSQCGAKVRIGDLLLVRGAHAPADRAGYFLVLRCLGVLTISCRRGHGLHENIFMEPPPLPVFGRMDPPSVTRSP